jgi:hypothetical protein
MHDGKDGHGHGGGAHAHDGGHTHAHEHTHDGGHTHDEAEATGSAIVAGKSKLKAILSYMKEHNREHANELHGLVALAQELGADEILDLIENGAKSIEAAAEQLEQALELIEEL